MKKRILIVSIIFILLISGLVIILLLNNNAKKDENNQEINFNENSLSDVTIDNGLLLTNSTLECVDNICTITITAKNSTSNNIDMSNYRISFLDANGEEIYWYSGNSIGIVEASSETVFSLELPSNLKDIDKITYTENTF